MTEKDQDSRLSDWLPGALLLVLVAAFALGYWHAFYKATFHGLFINDAWDYASMARNIALGRGVLSEYLTPLGLAHLGVPQPDLWRAPLWPVLLAVFQKIFGFKDEASALAGGACFGACACLVFVLGRRWFNLPVAIAATLLYIFSSQLLIFSDSGLTEPLSVLLMLAWFYLLTGPRADAWWQPLLAGAAGGLFYLARYNAGLFFLPGLVYIWWRPALKRKPRPVRWTRRRRCGGRGGAFNVPFDFNPRDKKDVSAPCWAGARGSTANESGNRPLARLIRPAVLFMVGILLVTGPWLARNYTLTGSPFFTLQKYEPAMFTATYPQYSLYMLPERIDVTRFIISHPPEMAAKVVAAWAEYRHDFFTPKFSGVALGVMVLFLLSLLLPLGLWFPSQRGVRPLLVACYLLQLVVLLPLHYIDRLFIIFAPLFMLYAAGGVWALGRLAAAGIWGRLRRPPEARGGALQQVMGRGSPLVVAVTLLVLAIFTVAGVRANYPNFRPPSEGPHPLSMWGEQHLHDVQGSLTGNQVVVSDIGQFFAWYGNRYACKLPLSPQLLPRLGALAPIRAIFLSHWITWDTPEMDPAWLAVYRTRPRQVEGFVLYRVYDDGSLLYVR
ncbi:MAG: glycosyltransferase family 39 protein [Thermacetogeniaceae bacterium]